MSSRPISRRLLVMLAFGFASGLPWPLSGMTLRQWMTESGLSLTLIGATASLGISYSLKFLWAPLLDRLPPALLAGLGRRRGWLLLIQSALLLSMIIFAIGDPTRHLTVSLVVAATIAFMSASQDIIIDAWRIETFGADDQPAALAAYTWGYRLALLVSGSAAFALATILGWHGALLVVSAGGLIGVGATFFALEPTVIAPAPRLRSAWQDRLAASFAAPIAEFLRRPGAAAVITYVVLFKLGEAMAAVMLLPLYHSLGFHRGTIAWIQGPIALTATICGYLAGGRIVSRIGLGRALIVTGFGQMIVMTLYIALAASSGSRGMLIATSIAESFVEGIADAAFLTFLSVLCAPAYTATQYALLSSAAALPLRTLGGLAGKLAGVLGFTAFYSVAALASLPAMLVMLLIVKRWPAVSIQPVPA